MGTFASVSLYDRGSTKPVSGRTVRVSSWPDGGPVETDPAVLTTDYYGATAEFQTVDPDVHVVRITAAAAQPRTVVSVEKQLAAAPELPPATNDGDILTVEDGEWVAGSIPPGVDIKVGGSQPAEGWWLDNDTAPAPDIEVTPTGPTWTDDEINGGGTWNTPTQTGITYSPASGTATPGQTVVVTATPLPGYAIVGATSWTHTFPHGPAAEPDWSTLVASDDFDRANSGAGGLGTAPAGGAWADPTASFGIVGGTAVNSGSTNGAITTLPTTATDARVVADMVFAASTAGQYGVVARANTTHDTYYHARVNGGTSVQLYRAVGGSLTSLGSHAISPAITVGETRTLTLRVWESTATELRVDLDGTEVITTTDDTGTRPTGGRVGLRAGSSVNIRFDSITAHT